MPSIAVFHTGHLVVASFFKPCGKSSCGVFCNFCMYVCASADSDIVDISCCMFVTELTCQDVNGMLEFSFLPN